MVSRASTIAATAALLAMLAAPGIARAQGPLGQPENAPPLAGPIEPIALRELPTEQRQRARELFGLVVCACPKENWSRVLANCPDGCADRQKTEIMFQVRDGWSEEQILDFQLSSYGPKVLAAPRSGAGMWVYVLPFAALLLGAAAVASYLSRVQAVPRPDMDAPKATDDEARAVEQELNEVE